MFSGTKDAALCKAHYYQVYLDGSDKAPMPMSSRCDVVICLQKLSFACELYPQFNPIVTPLSADCLSFLWSSLEK